MRIEIDTNGKRITDRDIRALYMLNYAINYQSTKKMRLANIQYFVDKLGYKLEKKKILPIEEQ